MNAADYLINTAAALNSARVSPALYAILTVVARAEIARGWATIPQMAGELRISFNAVHQHLQPHKSAHCFTVNRYPSDVGRGLMRIRLSDDGKAVLAEVDRTRRLLSAQVEKPET